MSSRVAAKRNQRVAAKRDERLDVPKQHLQCQHKSKQLYAVKSCRRFALEYLRLNKNVKVAKTVLAQHAKTLAVLRVTMLDLPVATCSHLLRDMHSAVSARIVHCCVLYCTLYLL